MRIKMPKRYSIALALAFIGVAPAARAQVCRPASDSSADMIQMVRNYALASDSTMRATRDSLRIPAVTSAAAVTLVTKDVTCKSANTAYQSVATGARQTLSGRVYVVQVGANFVVWDPAYSFDAAHPTWIYMVFDSKWVNKSIF